MIYSAVTDRTIRAKPTLPDVTAGKGTQFTDPTYGSRMLRVTDGTTRPDLPNILFFTPSGAETCGWNADNTYFYVLGSLGGKLVYSFNRLAMTATRTGNTGNATGGDVVLMQGEPEFSFTDPDLLYGQSSAFTSRLAQYRVSTATETTLHDINTVLPGVLSHATGISTSASPLRLALGVGGSAQDTDTIVYVWDATLGARWMNVATGQIGGWGSTGAYTGASGFTLHNVRISRNGRWVRVGPSSGGVPEYVWDITTKTLTAHADWTGHVAFGYDHILIQTGTSDCIRTRVYDLLTNTESTVPTTARSPALFDSEGHPCWNAVRADDLQPFITELWKTSSSVTGAWDEEIVAVGVAPGYTDTVWRFCHHRTDFGAADSFTEQPRPNVSRDGRVALFSSNWEDTVGSARVDVFAVELAATPTWSKISATQTDYPTNIPANWYFSQAVVSRLTGRIFHTWNGRDYSYNPTTNLWSAAGSTNNIGWRENYGCSHDSDLNVVHYSPGTSGPTEWSGAIKYDLGSLTWTTEATAGVAHAAHLWDPTRKTLRNFGGWTSNEPLRSRVTNPSGAWTATSPSGTPPPLTTDGSRETCRRAVMDTRNGNMYCLADNQDLYKYTASTNAWSLVSVTGTKPETFAVLGIHETANMLVTYCGDNSMVEADARVPKRTTRVLDLTELQWKLLATTANDPLLSVMCQTILMWDPVGDRVLCLQTEPGTAYSQVYALGATTVGTPPTLYTVTVTLAGTGLGSVTGAGAFEAGDTVNLTATAASGSTFTGYSVAEPFIMPANNVAVTATFTLDTPPPPPPPPGDLNLLVRQWNPRPLPGLATNSAPFLSGGQTKDVNGCYDTQRRIMYLGTGDFSGAGGSQSGRPEIFSYRAETNTFGLVSGLSHPAGQITPNHPTDRGPMIYDGLRDRIWLFNAVPFPDTEGQFTSGGSVYMAGLLYLQLSTGVWSFVADRNWSSSLGNGAYDTASDSMLFFEQGGFGPGQGGRLRVVPLTNPVNGGTTYNLTASPSPTWTGAAGGWLVPQQPERPFFAWDNQARVLYIINRQIRVDAAGTVIEQRAAMHSFSMVTRTWTMRTHAAALSSATTLSPYSIFCWWDSNTSRVIWPVVTGPEGVVTQMLAYTPATDTWEDMIGGFTNMRANCGFFIPSVNAAIGAGSVFDATYTQTNLFLWLDGPAPPNTGGDVTAPSCTLTAPASAATISGAAVAVAASATDNVAVSRVDFYFDGALFATDAVAPYAVVLNTLSASDGSHTISARAVDTSTNVSTFSTVTVTVRNNPAPPSVPPVCTITSHTDSQTVSGTISVVGTITDADGVLMGELLVNGVLNTKQDFGPNYSWDVVTTAYADGPMTLKIKGTDNSAAHDVGFSATVTVNVVNTVADITAPAVAITSPAPAAVISGTETVTVTATDAVGVVGGVDLYVDGVKVLTDLASPYSLDLVTTDYANGNVDLVAKARDAAGNIGTSATVTVEIDNTVPPPSDTEPPVVSVLTPVAGAVSGTISLTATATDNVAVTFVSYYLDGVKLTGDFATPPYTRSLDTTALTAGTHSIQARARDADLNEGISAFVQIIVPAPVLPVVCAITSPTDGAVLSGTTSVVCTASHADGVARVDLYFRGVMILTLDTAPFTFSVDTTLYADGPGILQVRGYTAGGANEGLGTADVLVTIHNAAPPTTNPTIVITSPTNGENVSGTIDVVVLTTGSPIRVVVDVGGVPLSVEASDLELLTDTPTIPVDTTRVANGLQPIIAHAYGIETLVGHSQTIYVTIGNTIPEVVTATAQQTTGGQDLWRNTARGFRRRRGRRHLHHA